MSKQMQIQITGVRPSSGTTIAFSLMFAPGSSAQAQAKLSIEKGKSKLVYDPRFCKPTAVVPEADVR